MTPLINPFTGPENVLWFILGILSVQVWQWVKCKWKDHTDPGGSPHVMRKLNWFYVWVAIVFAVIVAVGIQNVRTYTFAEKLARDTAACQYQFNRALVATRDINAEDRGLRLEWEEATLKRVAALINLPPSIQNNTITDPSYVAYKTYVDQEYFETLGDIAHRRAVNDRRRALPENQYPEPTCGKPGT